MVTETTTIKSINPATREILGEVPCLGAEAVRLAVDKAWQTYKTWSTTSYKQRAAKIMHLRQLLVERADELAQLVTREVGKPLLESTMSELSGPLEACAWFADNTEKALRDHMIALSNPLLFSKQSIITFEPLGAIGIISPWNYPLAIPMMSIIMALMTGNTVVLKPSEKSSLIGIKIGELFLEAGFPEGAVVVVTGDRTTGAALTECELARILFTGSVEGGQKVMASAAKQLTPVSLELGGKDAAIVLPDAPPDWTARGLVWGAFTNCGQACASIERVYIVKGPKTEELLAKIKEHAAALKLGPGNVPTNDVGPLIDEGQLQKVSEHVQDAVSRGATVLVGGKRRDDLGGFFYEPTVLTDVESDMTIMREETFGPVLPIMVVDSEDAAIDLTNRSEYGLSASIWTNNLDKAEDIAEDLEVGTVTINDALFAFACPEVPWGGLKKSGYGRTHSSFGLTDLVNIKHTSIDAAGGMHRQWWYPYNQGRIDAVRGGIKFLHSSNLLKKISGSFDFLINSLFNKHDKP